MKKFLDRVSRGAWRRTFRIGSFWDMEKSPQEKIPCACKTLKGREKLIELLEEVLNMIKLRHENIVVMYGVVVSKKMSKTNLQIVNFFL